MTHFLVLLLALLIGVVAGLRALTAPAVVAWGAMLDWINLDGTWAEWVAHPITVTVLTFWRGGTDHRPVAEDAEPQDRDAVRRPADHRRLRRRGHRHGVLPPWVGLGAGLIGAVLGTLGGAEARRRLVAANGGHDLPVALVEDAVAVWAACRRRVDVSRLNGKRNREIRRRSSSAPVRPDRRWRAG